MWSLRRNPSKIATETPLTLHADKNRLLHIIQCESASKFWCILNTLMTKIVADYYIFTIKNCRKIKNYTTENLSNICEYVHRWLQYIACHVLVRVHITHICQDHFTDGEGILRLDIASEATLEMWKIHWATPRRTGDINTNNNTTAIALITRFMGPTWGPSGADRTQVGPCWPHGLGILYVVPDSQDLCIRLDQLWSDSARQIYLWAQTLSSIYLHSFTRY